MVLNNREGDSVSFETYKRNKLERGNEYKIIC